MSNGNVRISAFTTKYGSRMRVLPTQVLIAEAFDPRKQREPELHEYKCIWDTGATSTVITEKVIADLRLQPTGKAQCQHAGGQSIQNTYLIAVKLPNGVGFPSLKVAEGKLQDIDALIGMDIIGSGDFAVTTENGNTVLSYEIPSNRTIDFVKDLNKQKRSSVSSAPTHPALKPGKRRKKGRKKRR